MLNNSFAKLLLPLINYYLYHAVLFFGINLVNPNVVKNEKQTPGGIIFLINIKNY
jgi:hypothetical protein